MSDSEDSNFSEEESDRSSEAEEVEDNEIKGTSSGSAVMEDSWKYYYRKSPSSADEQWRQGNMWEMAEWLEDEADTKPFKKSAHTYIRLQLIKQETDGTDCELSLEQALHQSVFMTSMSSDPRHRIHPCWEKQCHLLPEVSAYTAQTVRKWDAEEVAVFVQQLPGCMEQASVFREEQIDGEAFLLLTQTDLVKILGLKLGPALKIYNSILMFHNLAHN